MIKKVLLLLLSNLVFIAIVVTVYAIGYEYDRAYRLFPEYQQMSYDWGMYVYGKRWERVATAMLIVGALTNAAILLRWYRNWQQNSGTNLDLGP